MRTRSHLPILLASCLVAWACTAPEPTAPGSTTNGSGQPAPGDDAAFFTSEDYHRVDKIDFHAHIHQHGDDFVELAESDRFRFVNIATHAADPEEMRVRHETVFAQLAARPDRVIAVSSFPMAGWDDPGWQERTIAYLEETFERGAVAVKLWKNIGMELEDRDGRMVMVDHPRFDPIFEHLARRGIPVIGHLGEPRECWLPLEEMVTHRGYFASHPEYHMFLHPEMPSYEDQLAARDRLLERHPELRFAAAHLASLEWNVDELARFLDRFPDVIVETAARVRDLQYQSSQDRERVRRFLIGYQDRVAYGTDLTVRPSASAEEAIAAARRRWLADWSWFATDAEVEVSQLPEPVRGLQLPREVVEKLYRLNAERFFGDPWSGR